MPNIVSNTIEHTAASDQATMRPVRMLDAWPAWSDRQFAATMRMVASSATSRRASGSAVSQDGSIALSTVFVIHTHATDYTSVHVTQTATGQDVRVFSPTSSRRQVALSNPNASQLYSIEGQAVAVWCP